MDCPITTFCLAVLRRRCRPEFGRKRIFQPHTNRSRIAGSLLSLYRVFRRRTKRGTWLARICRPTPPTQIQSARSRNNHRSDLVDVAFSPTRNLHLRRRHRWVSLPLRLQRATRCAFQLALQQIRRQHLRLCAPSCKLQLCRHNLRRQHCTHIHGAHDRVYRDCSFLRKDVAKEPTLQNKHQPNEYWEQRSLL